jgi:uncharacterized protein (TIGR00369 family)
MTLVEWFRAMARGDEPEVPAHALIGIRFVAAEAGLVTLALEAGERHYANPLGIVHGGIISSLADSALSCAYASTLEEGENMVTLETKLNHLRPVRGGELTAVGRLVQRGRTVGLTECDITDGEGRLVARASATCMTIPATAG